MAGCVCVQLVEIGYTHGQVGVGEQLDSFCLGTVGQLDGDVSLDSALL